VVGNCLISVPISAKKIWTEVSLKPTTLLQSFNGLTKGLKRGLDPLIEGRDRPLQPPNGLQLLADAELMMRAHATVQ
jgi:hypothetical protein